MSTKELTLEQKVQKVLDIQEVQNVMSHHQFMASAGKNKEELETIWAQKAPDVSFGQIPGRWVGMKAIMDYYGAPKGYGIEKNFAALKKVFPDINFDKTTFTQHSFKSFITLTTPIIEIAGDGQTAKGVWYAPGYLTHLEGEKFDGWWMWERYAVDFIKEDGEWKIWHFNVFTDIACPYNKSWVDLAMERIAAKTPPRGGIPGLPPPNEAPTLKWSAYDPTFVGDDFPLPVPYETFSETFSY